MIADGNFYPKEWKELEIVHGLVNIHTLIFFLDYLKQN